MDVLDPLFHPITRLKGVGPEIAKAAKRVIRLGRGSDPDALPTIRDVILHTPMRYEDRRALNTVAELRDGQLASLHVRVIEHIPPAVRKGRYGRPLPYKIWVEDTSGSMQLVFFHERNAYLSKLMPVGAERIISGRVTMQPDGTPSMVHPDYMLPPNRSAEALRIVPIYPATKGFGSKQIAKLMPLALGHISPSLPEWLTGKSMERLNAPAFEPALRNIHNPTDIAENPLTQPHWQRLAYDELLAHQITLRIGRQETNTKAGYPFSWQPEVQASIEAALPFRFTKGQQAVLAAIETDMNSGNRMHRLVQGDVGSGKTILAFSAIAQAVKAGYQAILMAPTDVLARQHVQSLRPLAEAIGEEITYLSGKMPKAEQRTIQARIAEGEATIIVGTHAVFQDAVNYKALALIVVDEQQRFGVSQRLALTEKGDAPHLLQLSATPIPRSLMMTYYGDMDVSVLDEKPPGRQPIETRIVTLSRQDEVIAGLKRRMDAGEKIYWVCPLIDPSEEDTEKDMHETAAAEDRATFLDKHFPGKVGLIHGRMKPAEREQVMQAFAYGDLCCLVATTVIEVGVNVPEATVMVIEAAERFGLSQLHQLRGRVGRGSEKSHCILLYHTPISAHGKTRLSLLRDTEDGFKIAEEDLRLRGAGDVLGTRQTGVPEFIFADIVSHADMLRMARDEAEALLAEDPALSSKRGKAIRMLMRFWGYDAAMARLQGS